MTSTVLNRLFCILAIVLWGGCSSPKYPGFSKMEDGIYFRLNVIGDGKIRPVEGDVVRISFRVMTLEDSLIFEKADTIVFVGKKNEEESGVENSTVGLFPIMKCLTQLNEGDSGTFIFNFSGRDVRMDLKISEMSSFSDYEKRQRYLAWKNDAEINEFRKLKQYLLKINVDDNFLTDGIYFIQQKKGKGRIVEIGNTVVVHYRGSFPDSTVFDSTYEKGEPFEFKFGDDSQVIKGLELAICQMRKGEKAKIIIPSLLAFGEAGSSTGIVPPFTTVEYEVEIVNLK